MFFFFFSHFVYSLFLSIGYVFHLFPPFNRCFDWFNRFKILNPFWTVHSYVVGLLFVLLVFFSIFWSLLSILFSTFSSWCFIFSFNPLHVVISRVISICHKIQVVLWFNFSFLLFFVDRKVFVILCLLCFFLFLKFWVSYLVSGSLTSSLELGFNNVLKFQSILFEFLRFLQICTFLEILSWLKTLY